MIIKLIDHVQVTEKFIGKQLHVVAWGRALGQLLLLLLLNAYLLIRIAIASVQQTIRRCNTHGLDRRLELTVVRWQQIVVLSLESERQIGWRRMRPQRTDRIFYLVVVVVAVTIVVHRTAHVVIAVVVCHSIPNTSADILRSQQLRLTLLTVTDGRRKRSLQIAFGHLRHQRRRRGNVPNGAERLFVRIILNRWAAPQRVEVAVLRRRHDRRRLRRLPERIFAVAAACASVRRLHWWCRVGTVR